ncbi:hypothetical protein KIPB_005139 [Kipferlia bialata]|uniref:Uncharacterized protein n=1 Tax=Kipferlia bialata TaxID=797122 RepID=A0A9K3CUX3_9EUKA|nr:hypothetical protein KIPB_005139 [Kipferlia bialata]|eukprot:g5139.t1
MASDIPQSLFDGDGVPLSEEQTDRIMEEEGLLNIPPRPVDPLDTADRAVEEAHLAHVSEEAQAFGAAAAMKARPLRDRDTTSGRDAHSQLETERHREEESERRALLAEKRVELLEKRLTEMTAVFKGRVTLATERENKLRQALYNAKQGKGDVREYNTVGGGKSRDRDSTDEDLAVYKARCTRLSAILVHREAVIEALESESQRLRDALKATQSAFVHSERALSDTNEALKAVGQDRDVLQMRLTQMQEPSASASASAETGLETDTNSEESVQMQRMRAGLAQERAKRYAKNARVKSLLAEMQLYRRSLAGLVTEKSVQSHMQGTSMQGKRVQGLVDTVSDLDQSQSALRQLVRGTALSLEPRRLRLALRALQKEDQRLRSRQALDNWSMCHSINRARTVAGRLGLEDPVPTALRLVSDYSWTRVKEAGVSVAVRLARFLCLDIRAWQSRRGIMLAFRHRTLNRFLTSLASAPAGAMIAPEADLTRLSALHLARLSSLSAGLDVDLSTLSATDRGHLLESVLTYCVSGDVASLEGVRAVHAVEMLSPRRKQHIRRPMPSHKGPPRPLESVTGAPPMSPVPDGRFSESPYLRTSRMAESPSGRKPRPPPNGHMSPSQARKRSTYSQRVKDTGLGKSSSNLPDVLY